MSVKQAKKAERDDPETWTGRVTEGVKTGTKMQTRFKTIPSKHLNKETVFGIRDMKLGRVKNGVPTGKPIIRFDTGLNSGTDPHINIDPKGFPNPNNPHIPVSGDTVNAAKTVGKTLKYVGVGLTVAAVVVDSWRIFSAVKDDIYLEDHADEVIEELENAIEKLKTALKSESSSSRRNEIRKTIDHLQKVLKDAKRVKKGAPVKTIKTASSVAGGWSAGAAGGAGGAWAGAQTGAWIGSIFGPIGTVVGAPVGAVVGAIGAGIGSAMAGSYVGEKIADTGLSLLDD